MSITFADVDGGALISEDYDEALWKLAEENRYPSKYGTRIEGIYRHLPTDQFFAVSYEQHYDYGNDYDTIDVFEVTPIVVSKTVYQRVR
jgi:hypothetical protein